MKNLLFVLSLILLTSCSGEFEYDDSFDTSLDKSSFEESVNSNIEERPSLEPMPKLISTSDKSCSGGCKFYHDFLISHKYLIATTTNKSSSISLTTNQINGLYRSCRNSCGKPIIQEKTTKSETSPKQKKKEKRNDDFQSFEDMENLNK